MTRIRVLMPVLAVALAVVIGGGYAVAQGADASGGAVRSEAADSQADVTTTSAVGLIELPETQKCMAEAGYPRYLGTGNLEGPVAAALDACLPEPEPKTPAELAAMRADVERSTDQTVRCMAAAGFHPRIDEHPEGVTFDPPGSGFVITYGDGEMVSKGFEAASKRCG